jgi:hypothetical protein
MIAADMVYLVMQEEGSNNDWYWCCQPAITALMDLRGGARRPAFLSNNVVGISSHCPTQRSNPFFLLVSASDL